MNYNYLLALIVAMPMVSIAQEVEQASPFYIKGGINGSVLNDDMKNSEAMGYEAMLGVQFENGIFIEGGYQNFDLLRDDDIDLDAFSARLNWKYAISDYASVYGGGGVAVIDSEASPSAQLGIQYQLSSNWVADVSYQGIFDIDQVNDDLYSLNLSLIYRFPGASSSRLQSDYGDETVTNVVAEPVIEPPVVTPVTPPPPRCSAQRVPYILVNGDFLIGVAQANNVSLEQLVRLNPQLQGRNLDLVYIDEQIYVPKQVCE